MSTLGFRRSTSWLIAPILAWLWIHPPAAIAQDSAWSGAYLAAYKEKLSLTQRMQKDYECLVQALESRNADWMSRSAKLERERGDLERRKDELKGECATREAELEGFRRAFESEKRQILELQNRLDHLRAERRGQETALSDCKSKWFTIDALCDAALEIAHLVGAINKVEGDIAATENQLRTARASSDDAQRRLSESRTSLQAASLRSSAVQDSILLADSGIKRVKSALSVLRGNVQTCNHSLDELEALLQEAATIDTDDGRARSKRRLERISAEIDSSLARSVATARSSSSLLPTGWRQRCAP